MNWKDITVNFKSILKWILNHSSGIIFFIFIGGFILYIGQLAIEKIDDHFYKKIFYIYACPEKLKNGSCIKGKANYVSSKWNGDDYEEGYFDKVYFDNGSSIEFSSCFTNDGTYFCTPVDEIYGDWKLEISEIKKVRK